MIKRIAFSAVFLTLLLILQSTWLGFMSISSVIPDLATLALVYISFKSPGMQGQITGFICGLLQDGVSAAPFGLNAFVKTILAWFFNMISGRFQIDRIVMPTVFGFSATIGKNILIRMLSLIFPQHILIHELTQSKMWIESAYNGIIAPLFFLMMGLIDRFILPWDSLHDR